MMRKERRKRATGRAGWRWRGAVVLVAAVGAGALVGPGCGIYPYRCEDYSECPPEGPACTGQCVPIAPLEFNGPALLWIGKESEAPQCPPRAPQNVYEGHADLDPSYECAACECAQPACELWAGVTASNSAGCQGPVFTPFQSPSGWDGSCTSPATVSTLGSVSIAQATLRPCTPVPPEMPQNSVPPSPWGTFARACAGEAIPNVCGDPGLTCLPTAEPPPPGFRQCIIYLGDGVPQCPDDYPEQFLFYGSLEDTRDCSPCECVQTAPGDCAAWLSLYQGPACEQSSLLLTSMITEGPGPICLDVPAGVQQLQSMQAEWITNEPGACEPSGGQLIGDAIPTNPRHFCCQPSPG